ncbi:MAG: PrsW family glutamic-type intramembrane protease [Moheibacter sp.]
MHFLLFILSALLPVVFFCFFIYLRDTEKEPIWMLALSFLIGALITLPIAGIEFGLTHRLIKLGVGGSLKNFLNAFVIAGIVEEGVKYIAVYLFLRRNRFFDQCYDGIVYAAFISLGFASVENLLYIWRLGFETAIVRAFMSIPAHMLFAVFMGYYFALGFRSDQKKRTKHFLLALIIPVFLHGLYDFFLFDLEQSPVIYFVMITILCLSLWRYGLRRIRTLIAFDKERMNNEESRLG